MMREKCVQKDVLINHFSSYFSLISPNKKRGDSRDILLELHHLNHSILKIESTRAVAIICRFSSIMVCFK